MGLGFGCRRGIGLAIVGSVRSIRSLEESVVTRTFGAAIGAVIFVLFLSEMAAHLGPFSIGRDSGPVVVVSQR
jgi:hypothetical protein